MKNEFQGTVTISTNEYKNLLATNDAFFQNKLIKAIQWGWSNDTQTFWAIDPDKVLLEASEKILQLEKELFEYKTKTEAEPMSEYFQKKFETKKKWWQF